MVTHSIRSGCAGSLLERRDVIRVLGPPASCRRDAETGVVAVVSLLVESFPDIIRAQQHCAVQPDGALYSPVHLAERQHAACRFDFEGDASG